MIYVVTGNSGKYNEIKEVLDAYNIESEQNKIELEEKDSTLEDTALSKARQAFAVLKEPLIVDDSGIFFDGYDNFPGHRAKRVFEELGFEGLLKYAPCKAYFKCVICFTDGKTTKLFDGVVNGRIADKAYGYSPEGLPYDSIFVPEGYDKVFALLPPKTARSLKHRTIAVKKFAEWFTQNFKSSYWRV